MSLLTGYMTDIPKTKVRGIYITGHCVFPHSIFFFYLGCTAANRSNFIGEWCHGNQQSVIFVENSAAGSWIQAEQTLTS